MNHSKHTNDTHVASDGTPRELREGIDHTRQAMTKTLTAIEERLSPETLAGKAHAELDLLEHRLRATMKDGVEEARQAVNEGLHEAREATRAALAEGIHEAKVAIAEGLEQARQTVKRDVEQAITDTKHSVREATLGRVETIATKAGDVMNDTRETLVETIRQNPIPAALAGVGIAWLLMNRSSRGRQTARGDYGWNPIDHAAESVARKASGAATTAGDAVKHAGNALAGAASSAGTAVKEAVSHGAGAVEHLAEQTSEAAGRLMHDAADRTSHLVHGAAGAAGLVAHRAEDVALSVAGAARQQALRAETGVSKAWESNPLVFGATALLTGAAIGFALPRTDREDKLMGGARDRALHEAAEMATAAVKSAQQRAEEAGKAAKQALSAGG